MQTKQSPGSHLLIKSLSNNRTCQIKYNFVVLGHSNYATASVYMDLAPTTSESANNLNNYAHGHQSMPMGHIVLTDFIFHFSFFKNPVYCEHAK